MTVIKSDSGGFAFQLPGLPAQGEYESSERAEYVGRLVELGLERVRSRRLAS